MSKYKKLVVKSESERFVMVEVYSPLQVDTEGDAMTVKEIRKMAHLFLMKGKTDKLDIQHSFEESGCLVAESFMARSGDPDGFIEGAWVLGFYVVPDDIWAKVLKGDLNGVSWAGNVGTKVPVLAEVKISRKMTGDTEESLVDDMLPRHTHKVMLLMTDSGSLIPTETSAEMGHAHSIIQATATESAFEHSHRMVLIDNPTG